MFKIIRRETFDRIVRERDQGDDYAVQAAARIVELEQQNAELRAQLDDRQVIAVRDEKTGRFTKREG